MTNPLFPNFQNHYEQLEQEYDAPTDIIEEEETPESGGPGPYPRPIPQQQQQQHQQQQHQMHGHQNVNTTQGQQQYPSMTQLLDPYDPILDMDPFGLSASMQFPTTFSFDTSSMR